MSKTITITFDKDIPEQHLEVIKGKIRAVLRGEAVPEDEVVGQWDPGSSSVGAGSLSLNPDKIHGGPMPPGER